MTTITLLPYNTPILPLRVHDHAPCQAKPRTAYRLLLHRRRVCIALGASERVPRVPVCASALAKGAPAVAVRACIMRGRTVLWSTLRRRHGKPSSVAWCDWLRQWCVKSSVACAWLASGLCGVGVVRRVVPVRWRACVGAVCAPLRNALAVCMCVCTHAPQTSCA